MTHIASDDLRGITAYIANEVRKQTAAKRIVAKIKEVVTVLEFFIVDGIGSMLDILSFKHTLLAVRGCAKLANACVSIVKMKISFDKKAESIYY